MSGLEERLVALKAEFAWLKTNATAEDGLTIAMDALARRDRTDGTLARTLARATCSKCGKQGVEEDGVCSECAARAGDARAVALRSASDALKFAAAAFHDVNQWRTAKALDDMQRQVLVFLEMHTGADSR